MNLPLAWLNEYLPKLPPTNKLVDTLMLHGIDVEETISGSTYDKVVVGQIVGIKPHPNADKLRLASVMIIPNGEPQEIVCGAPNIEVGQKVPVALLGAKLPNGLTIESRAIRGVISNGMLCAKDELGLGSDHSGIMVLDQTLKLGTKFSEVMGDDQTILDLATPANRADLMAIRGLAWEIGVMLGQVAKLPVTKLSESKASAEKSVTLKIADPQLCSLLTARVIRGVKLNSTPDWMVNRLRAAGMRSVNIIADITNYVMLDYGQPLHAYDLAQVHGATLIARSAKPEEHLITLDNKMRQLTNDTLVIADADRVIGIAGVMGGKDTEVTDSTTDIILEAAIFNPVSIRKTSRQLGLISEASKRFEKGLWPSLPERASAAAAALIVELCVGNIEQGSVRTGTAKTTPRTITMDPTYISQRLGTKIPLTKCKTTLTKLGFGVKGTAKTWKITVPEWRIDVAIPEDIVDEVGRMVGYEKLPKQMPLDRQVIKELPSAIRFKEEVKNILVDMGFTEVISHSYYGRKEEQIIEGTHFEVANPLDSQQYYLRRSLKPAIAEILITASDAGQDAAIFEISRVFVTADDIEQGNGQPWRLAIGIAMKSSANSTSQRPMDLLGNKLFMALGISDNFVAMKRSDIVDYSKRGRSLEIIELDIDDLIAKSKVQFGPWDSVQHLVKNIVVSEQYKYPSIKRDISLWTGPNMTLGKIIGLLQDQGEALLISAEKIDEFKQGAKHSLTFRLIFQSPDRTLTKAEVDKLEQKIKDALVKLGAVIR